jgi:hypothetical protein
LLLSATANVCFGLIHLMFSRNVSFANPPLPASPRASRNYLTLVFPFFLVTCALCYQYGWHQYTFAGHEVDVDSLGGMFTVTAYFKFFFVAIYLYYLYRFGLNKGAWILLGEHVIVMVVDGSRATFLPILLLTLFILLDRVSNQKMMRRIYLIAIAGIILSIGTRALILHSGNFLVDMIIPVTVEGSLGDYSALQTIQGVETLPHPKYTYGASYVIDPLVWLIPKFIGREGLSSFGRWTDDLANVLDEKFAPMGGFYYLSEAIAAYSYAGPAIVTLLFAIFLVWIERNKNRYPILYLSWMPTLGILFIKTPFGNCFKLFLIQLIGINILCLLRRIKLALPHRRREVRDRLAMTPG